MTCIRAFWAMALLGVCVGAARSQDAAPAASNSQTERWTRFKGDLQRTGLSSAVVPLPLNLVWRFSSDETPRGNSSSPIVAGPVGLRRVYFSTGNAVFCLEASTGNQLWKSDLTGFARAPIFLLEGGEGGDLVIATTTSGTINAMRASDGTVVWTAEVRAPVGGIEPIPVQTAKGLRLIQATQTGRVLSFALDGTKDPDFEVKLGRNGASPTATPALSTDGRTLFIPAQDKNLYAVSLDDASISWTARLGNASYFSPVVSGDSLFIQLGDEVLSLAASDGQQNWRTDLKLPIPAPIAVRVVDGRTIVYAGTFRGVVFALDGADGSEIWQSDMESPLTGTPLVMSNLILAGTRTGMLIGLSPDDGKIIWRYRLHTEREVPVTATTGTTAGGGGRRGTRFGGAPTTESKTFPISSAPAAVDGQVYVVADNAALYALTSTPLDMEAPLAINPSIQVRTAEGTVALPLVGRRPVLIPGKAPITFTVEIDDPGSGIDPAGFRVTMNDTEIPRDKLVFQPSTGVLTANLAEVSPEETVVLPDGVYTIGVLARDARGNALTYSGSFTVDKTMPPPTVPGMGGGRGGRGGRGNRGR